MVSTFDKALAARLDAAYLGRDVVARREANLTALDLYADARVVDIGCGAGHLTADLSRAVGKGGAVHAVDPSAPMRDIAEARCAEMANVTVADGTAMALPLSDDSCDRAVSIQVFEYLTPKEIAAALVEARRVLAPGGRIVVGDIHWDTLAIATDEPERMARLVAAYDRHLKTRDVPALLPRALADAGFTEIRSTAQTVVDCTMRPDGYAKFFVSSLTSYVTKNGLVDEAEAAAWRSEQHERARDGRFFLSLSHIVTTARVGERPAFAQ